MIHRGYVWVVLKVNGIHASTGQQETNSYVAHLLYLPLMIEKIFSIQSIILIPNKNQLTMQIL